MPHRKKAVNSIHEDRAIDISEADIGIDEADEGEHFTLSSDSFADGIQLTSSVSTAFAADQAATIECFHCHEIFTSTGAIQKHLLEKHVGRPVGGQVEFCVSEALAAEEVEVQQQKTIELSKKPYRKRKSSTQVLPGDSRALYKCDTCSFSALTPAALAIHRKTHSDPDRSSWYKCHLCDFSAKMYVDLTQHGESAHKLENGEFLCTCCSKTFENYAKVRRHVWQTHIDMNVVCQDCGKKFLRMDRLRKHAASAHSDTPAGHCLHCGKAFRRKDKLKDHQEVCAGVSSGASSSRHKKMNLSRHTEPSAKKRPGPKSVLSTLEPPPDDAYFRFPFRCDICRVGFKNHSDLLIHAEARHHDQIIPVVLPMVDLNQQIVEQTSISGQQYSCPHCQVSWPTLMEIKLHVSLDHPSQEDNKPSFECSFCMPGLGRKYAARERLVRHLRRQHRQLLTPLLRNNSSTNDQDVASHVEIGQQRSSLLSCKTKRSSSFNTSTVNSLVNNIATPSLIVAQEISHSSSQFMSPLPAMAFNHMDCSAQMVHSAPEVLDCPPYTGVVHHSEVCEAASPNFFSCESLTDLSALSVPDAPYSTEHHRHHHLEAMSQSVAVTHNQGCQVHQPAVYDASSLVCFADPISGLISQDPDESSAAVDNSYILATSPLPTSVLTACFDSPLTGPLNSHAYQLLE